MWRDEVVCVKHPAESLSPSRYSMLAIFIILGAHHLKLKVNFLFNTYRFESLTEYLS